METTATTATTPAATQTNSAMSAIPYPTSPFLRLPAELRNKIYTFIGLSTKIEVLNMQSSSKRLCPYTIPPFLRTCKQIRSEATALIYANATCDITRGDSSSWVTCCVEAKSCTKLQLCRVLSSQVAGYVHADRGRPFFGCPLPNLERVEVIWSSSQWGCKIIRGTLREWFHKEDLVVEFRDDGGMLTYW